MGAGLAHLVEESAAGLVPQHHGGAWPIWQPPAGGQVGDIEPRLRFGHVQEHPRLAEGSVVRVRVRARVRLGLGLAIGLD